MAALYEGCNNDHIPLCRFFSGRKGVEISEHLVDAVLKLGFHGRVLGFKLFPTVPEGSCAVGNNGLDLGRVEGDNLVQKSSIEEFHNYTVPFFAQPFGQCCYNVAELAHVNGHQPRGTNPLTVPFLTIAAFGKRGNFSQNFIQACDRLRLDGIILGDPENKHRFRRCLVALEFNASCSDGFLVGSIRSK